MWNLQICKAFLAFLKSGQGKPTQSDSVAGIPFTMIASLAREALLTCCAMHTTQDVSIHVLIPSLVPWAKLCCDERRQRTALATELIKDEVLPQARRWHRRELVPALEAVWRAVVRGLVRIETESSRAFKT